MRCPINTGHVLKTDGSGATKGAILLKGGDSRTSAKHVLLAIIAYTGSVID